MWRHVAYGPTSSDSFPKSYLLLGFHVLCLVFFGWHTAFLKLDNRIDRFAVAEGEAEQAHKQFTAIYEASNHFLVTLEFENVNGMVARGELFFESLVVPGVQNYYSYGTLFDEDVGAAMVLPFPFVERAHNCYTAIFIPDTEENAVFEKVFQRAAELEAREEGVRVVIAGEPVVNYFLNKSSEEVKEKLFPVLVILAMILLGCLFRSIPALVVSSLAVGASLMTTLGILQLSGQSMNLITTLVPSLVFVLAVAMQVHLLVSIAHRGVRVGLRVKLRANALVALTTSIGFGSLAFSQVAPIAAMGRMMAMAIWIIFFWTHVTHLSISPFVRLNLRIPKWNPFETMSASYGEFVRQRWLLFVPLPVLVVGAGVLVSHPVESNGLHYFPKTHRLRQDTSFLREKVTGTSQIELLLSGPSADSSETFVPNWHLIEQLENKLLEHSQVRHLLSLNRFVGMARSLGDPPSSGLDYEETSRELLGELRSWLPDLHRAFAAPSHYRIQLLVNSLNETEYRELKAYIGKVFAQLGFDYILTGPLDRVIAIQNYLLRSLASSLLLTVTISILLIGFLFGHYKLMVAYLVPNLFPLGCMSLCMWLFNVPISISSVMVFSIAFGIAIDDSIHLIDSFLARQQLDFESRWNLTLAQDGLAIAITTLTLCTGFLVLTVSSFYPTRQFGFLLAVGMAFALLGDVWLLPAFLQERRCSAGR